MNKQPSQSLREMKMQYDAIYGSNAKEYQPFPTIQDTMVLDSIEGEDILGTVIVNTSQTEMAQFLERIGATQWMRQAHETKSKNHFRRNALAPLIAAGKIDLTIPEKPQSSKQQYKRSKI